MDKLEQLKNKISEFQAKSAAKEEIKSFVTLVLQVLKKSKDNFDSLTAENLKTIKEGIAFIEDFQEKQVKLLDDKTNTATGQFDAKLALINDLLAKVEAIKTTPGKDGRDGVDGIGIDGKDGKDGKDGSPDTPIQIADKLNTLDEVIDQKVIKGLTKKITDISSNIAHGLSGSSTPFINGKMAKNINFTGATVSHNGDIANVAITGGSGSGTVDSVVAGTGISVNSTDPANPIVTNSAPDQTVSITAGTNITSVTGTYPNFTINAATQTTDISGLVPYTGATTDVNLGTHSLTAHSIIGDATDGIILEASNGTDIGILGAGNTANVTWYGSHNFSTATQDTIAAFTGAGKTLGSLDLATYPSLTELSYVKGVTSAIQTQLNGKQPSGSYLTGNETITLSGDVTGSGATSITTTIAAGAVDIAMLSATGTPSSSTYLRGDNTWATIAGGGDVTKVGTPVNNQVGVWTGDGTIEGDANLTFDTTTDTLSTVNINSTTIELGHASDTTLSRVSAGVVAIEGVNIETTATTANSKIASLTFVIDGGGSAITTGIKGDLVIPFACTINSVTMLADQSGSVVVDVWKDTYANYPPTVADTITAAAKPTITTATKSQDATLTGWTTSVAAGDTIRFNVDSATTITRVTLALKVTKT